MAALTQTRALDFGDALPSNARAAILRLLADEPRGTRKVYGALLRKVWSLLIERRFDPEVRDWHALVHDVKAHIEDADRPASERMVALADLLGQSISLSETSPARAVAARPNAQRILERLAKADTYVLRRELLADLGMRSQNLSNVLTQLLAHNLVERRDKGKEAEFRVTRLGRQLISELEQHRTEPALGPGFGAEVISLGVMLSQPVLIYRHSGPGKSDLASHMANAWLSATPQDVGVALQSDDLFGPAHELLPHRGAQLGPASILYKPIERTYTSKRTAAIRPLAAAG